MNKSKKLLSLFLAVTLLLTSIIVVVGAKTTNSIGDINCDGKVSAADARLALRFSVSLEKPTEEQKKSADVNGDGKVTASDARMILRVSVGLDKFDIEDEINDNTNETNFKFIDFYADTYDILVGETKEVIFYAEVLTENIDNDDSVELYSNDNYICTLYDNGIAPDLQANDNIYSNIVTLSNSKSEEVKYYAISNGEISPEKYINFHEEINETSIEKYINSCNNIDEIIKSSDEMQVKYDNIILYLENEIKNDNISNYDIGTSGIMIRWPNGLLYCVYFEALADNNDTNTTDLTLMSLDEIEKVQTVETFATAKRSVQGNEMIVLNPFYNSMPYDYFEQASKISNNVDGYTSCGEYRNENVTLEVLKKLDSYKIIIISTHGGFAGKDNNDFGFLYGTPANNEQAITDYIFDHKEDYQQGNIYRGVLEDGSVYWGVRTNFFRNNFFAYSFDDALVYMGACHGADNNALESVLTSKGVDSIFAFSGSVPSDYDFKMYESVFNNLLVNQNGKYETADNALKWAKITNGTNSNTYKPGIVGIILDWINGSSELHLLGNQKWAFGIVSDKCTITGTVTDSKTGKPISKVSVEAIDNENGSLEPVKTTITDTNGKYSLELPYGSYSLSFNHENYEYYGTSLSVNYEAYEKNATLSPKYNSGNTEERTVIDSGECGANGDNVTWTLYEDGELVISGNTNMEDYSSPEKTPWTSYRKSVKSVIIKSNVTSIGNYAFCDCPNLINISIPTTVTSIGNAAFEACVNLTSIIIPESVTSIGIGAFIGCNSLTSITIEENNKYYSNDSNGVLFNKDKTILIQYPSGNRRTKYIIPDSVTSVGDSAFMDCPNLINISIPNSVTSIGHYAFFNCVNLTSITIPDSVTSIGHYAFCYCDSLTSIKMPKSLTSIGKAVFYNCDSLTSIEIPDSVTIIGSKAFYDCDSLTSIELPDSVTSIGSTAFSGCDSLTSIKIPKRVTKIGNFAFCDCINLTSITIPNTVTNIGHYAFFVCNKLTNVYYTGTKQEWRKIIIGDDNECLINATIHYNS